MKNEKIKKAIQEMVKLNVMTEGEASAYSTAMDDLIPANKKWKNKLNEVIETLDEMKRHTIKSSFEYGFEFVPYRLRHREAAPYVVGYDNPKYRVMTRDEYKERQETATREERAEEDRILTQERLSGGGGRLRFAYLIRL